MKESHYKSYDDLPLFLNAKTVAKVLGVSPSSGYELLHDPGFPVMRVGNRMVVPKEQFVQWVKEHTGGGTLSIEITETFSFCPTSCFSWDWTMENWRSAVS